MLGMKEQFGCGVAHTVAHTTPVREDLGSILHRSPAEVNAINLFYQKILLKNQQKIKSYFY